MSDQAIARRDLHALSFDYTDAAVALRDRALEQAALIGKVANADDQRDAVAAQASIKEVLRAIEAAREEAKKPVLEFGRMIDAKAKEFSKELKAEELRLARLIGDFQQLEQARIRAAQQAENERLAELERQRARELAEAKSHEEIDAIQEKYSQLALSSPAPAPARVEGQQVTQDWEIEVVDIWTLARAHPACVKIEPRLSEIKNLLKAGVKVAGVRATPVIKSTVRVKPLAPAIDV